MCHWLEKWSWGLIQYKYAIMETTWSCGSFVSTMGFPVLARHLYTTPGPCRLWVKLGSSKPQPNYTPRIAHFKFADALYISRHRLNARTISATTFRTPLNTIWDGLSSNTNISITDKLTNEALESPNPAAIKMKQPGCKPGWEWVWYLYPSFIKAPMAVKNRHLL